MLNLKEKIISFAKTPITGFLLLLIIVFSFASPFFLTYGNFYNILLKATAVGVLALGLGFVIMNGNIDLSVGSLLGLTSAVFVTTYNSTNLTVAIAFTLLVGLIVGLWNGLCVWLLKIDSFIVTLASMIGVKGITFTVTKENSITLDQFDFTNLSSLSFLKMPVIGLIYIFIAIILVFVQTHTTHGRNVLFVGGNRKAARASGINTGFHMLINFVLCSFTTAVMSILLTAQLGAATPNTGRGYELWAIAAVALGGVKLIGGVGKISLVFLGGITIAVLRNGMNLLHLSTAYIYVVTGLVLLFVMFFDRYSEEVYSIFKIRKKKETDKTSSQEVSIKDKKGETNHE